MSAPNRRIPTMRPIGFVAIGAFLLFGVAMATYAGLTLLWPGTAR